MLTFKGGVSSTSHMKELKGILDLIKSEDVLVGIPQAKASRAELGEKINNAELLFIHTNGSPIRNIPARPVIEPAINEKTTKLTIMEHFKSAVVAAFEGNQQEFRTQLEIAGMVAQNAARAWFTNPANGWAPNAPATIKAKKSSRPLIDTGEMRKSIIYVVRRKT